MATVDVIAVFHSFFAEPACHYIRGRTLFDRYKGLMIFWRLSLSVI